MANLVFPRTGFNPDAATSAYLQTHATECRTLDCVPDHSPWISLALPAVTLLALWAFLATRLSVRACDLAKQITNRSSLQAALFALPLTLFVGITQLPVLFWLQRVVGDSPVVTKLRDAQGNWTELGRPSSVNWLIGRLYELGWTAVFMAIVLPVALVLIRRMPRRYWVIPALTASIWIIWLVGQNGYERVAPLPTGQLRAEIEAMARASGQSPKHIHIGEQRFLSGGFADAHVIWWEGRPQAVISERLFNVLPISPKNLSPPYRPVTAAEVRSAAGHELGHLKLYHLYWGPAALVAMAWLLAWLAATGARLLVFRFGPSWQVAGVTDPAALPAIALVFGVAFCAFFPMRNALQLVMERQADAAGLEIARDPDGFAALAMRDARGAPISRPVIEQWLFYSHPSSEDRIRHAMAWKAQHRPAPWRATGLSAPIRVRMGF